jgi:hypothetical protein
VGKPERFVRRLFQAAEEIIKKKLPKASLADFLGGGSFHSACRRAVFPASIGRVSQKQPCRASAVQAIVAYKRF